MAGELKPSTAKEEARFIHLGGKTSPGAYNKDGSGLFNGSIVYSGSLSEGNYLNTINDDGGYVLIKIEDYCNIYAHSSFNSKLNEGPKTNYVSSSTGILKILEYDGADYTIDVTDKYWVGRHFSYSGSGNASSSSHGLTFEEFLSTELIDRSWQKIVADLPPGQYKFTGNVGDRKDNEWFLEKIVKYSQRLKDSIKDTITNNKLIQNHCILHDIDTQRGD